MNRPEVYIGGDNSHFGAWPNEGQVTKYLNHLSEWESVRREADGYYMINFAMNQGIPRKPYNIDWIPRIAEAMTSKNVFYETDIGYSHPDDEASHLDYLARYFVIKYATLNYTIGDFPLRYTPERVELLRGREHRPVLAMHGPWLMNGDFRTSAEGIVWQNAIAAMDGASSDGPIRKWADDENGTRNVTYQYVVTTRLQGKLAMVSLSPNRSPSGEDFTKVGKECVNWLERRGALPDIWVISHYDDNNVGAKATPENEETITGFTKWLIGRMRYSSRKVDVYRHQDHALNSHWRDVFADGHSILRSRHIGDLEVKDASDGPDADVRTFPHIGEPEHSQWRLHQLGGDFFTIKDRKHGRHLQVVNAGTDNNTRVSVFAHTSDPDHAVWKRVSKGNGWFSLHPRHEPALSLQVDSTLEREFV